MKVFEHAWRLFGVSKGDWIHVAQSLYHDVIPARKFGLRTVLVRRRGFGATPKVKGEADFTIKSLREIFSISPLGL